MKKLILFVFLSTSLISFTTQSNDNEVTGIYLTLGANQFFFDDDRLLNDEASFYLGAGYQLSNHWALGFEYTDIATERSWIGGNDFDTEFWSINGIYRYAPRDQNGFFWKIGAGKYTETPETSHAETARLGIGYDFALSKNISFTLGTDALVGVNKSRFDKVVYAGLNFSFGHGTQKAPTIKKPKDSDNDGILDSQDRCSHTKLGTAVDSNGCQIKSVKSVQLDSDNDGIFNSVDQCPKTPAGAKVNHNGCRIILKEDVSIKLNVQFANNSNQISNNYQKEINKVAEFMRQYPDTKVTIEGHTDSRGSAQYNQQLSQKRAEAVMNYLIQNFSVKPDRINAEGKGEAFPIADNETSAGRKINRRVQAEIKTTVSKPQ